jgi:predicted RND superfamily exporter protein/lauroyl/myristoyl acyltransferase
VSRFLKRWWWALLAVAVCLGLYRLRFDVDILNLLPPDEPTVQGLKLYQKHFTNARELVLTLRAPEGERAERLAGAIAARLRQETNLVAEVSWQPPWMEDPAQMAELLGSLWLNQPPDAFAALTNRLAPSQLKAVLDQTKEELRTSMSPLDMARRAFDPFDLLNMPGMTNLTGLSSGPGQQMFASAEGNFRLLFIQSAIDLGSYRTCESWLKSIREVVAGLRAKDPNGEWAGAEVHFTGRPVFVVEIAGSMQRDMSGSVVGTSLIIALLFWLTHRRWLPMFWLLTLLALILVATLALGGLVLGAISVVSMGFAAVLLGLAVDYAVVHYQEALAHPQLTVPEIRRAIAPSILWAAITTMSAFLVLNLGGLPGLAQLGTLVAIGVGLAALVMVMIYLPPLFPERRKPRPDQKPIAWSAYFRAPTPERGHSCPQQAPIGNAHTPTPTPLCPSDVVADRNVRAPAPVVTGVVLFAACAILCVHRPGLDRTGDALRPQRAEAETALDEIKHEMGLPPDPLWLIISGRDEPVVYQHLTLAEGLLNGAVSNHIIGGYLLPTALWPRAELQTANRQTAAVLGQQGPLLRETAFREGFSSNAMVLTEELVRTWARAGASTNVFWPTNKASQWLLKRFVAKAPDQLLVMGLVYPATNQVDAAALARLSARLSQDQAFLSGWELLGSTTLKRVQAKLWQVVAPMVGLVLASLWFAFRRPTEILLGLAVQLLSGLCLLAVMSVAGWSWNLLNLMALPLMLGTGVDYSIFMQLALRRHDGDLGLVRRSIGRALLLCGGTAMAGFGSLGCSSNPGMASLGRVCAVGIGANMLFSVFLLPAWWAWLNPKAEIRGPKEGRNPRSETGTEQSCAAAHQSPDVNPASPLTHHVSRITRPPSLYRAGLWRLGLFIVRFVPTGLLKGFCVGVAAVYVRVRRQRVEVVVQNLLPVVGGDRVAAEKAARRLHHNFAVKLVDLWRLESGVPVHDFLTDPSKLEIIQAARRRGRGIIFITLHLGNWEHGGQLLSQLDIPLTILTQAEPDDGLTALRIASRRRCGVETLVIGQDSFAFIEVIKRLQDGAALALALDRPPARGGVGVELFGRPFTAPAAAAELARASGCALVGVTIVRRPNGYAVTALPEFTYERRALGNHEARRELTQQILRAFEPAIRDNIDQWYQFVPIWPQCESRTPA